MSNFIKIYVSNIVSLICFLIIFSIAFPAYSLPSSHVGVSGTKLNLTIDIMPSSAVIRNSQILSGANINSNGPEYVAAGSTLPSELLQAADGYVLLDQILNAVDGSILIDQTMNAEQGDIKSGQLMVIARDIYSNELFRQTVEDPGFIRAEIFSSETGVQEFSKTIYSELASFDFSLDKDPNISFLSLYRAIETEQNDALKLVQNLILPYDLDNLSPSSNESIFSEVDSVTTIIDNGDSDNRVDIVIIGDGYTAGELDKYEQDVAKVMGDYFSVEPYNSYQNFFNVHRVNLVSNESGIDHPEKGVERDTVLNGTYNCASIQRLICVDTAKAFNIVKSELDESAHDIVLVIVNDNEYGGSGGALAVISTHASSVDLALHEIGHSFGHLADEYEGNDELCSLAEPSELNVSTVLNSSTVKWNHWIDVDTDLPTDESFGSQPGLYEGAKYCSKGMYRPTNNSMMRSLGRTFDRVNEEILVKRIYDFVEPLDSVSPAQQVVEVIGSQIFSVILPEMQENTIDTDWYLNDKKVATTASFNLSAASLSSGNNTLRLEVVDNTSKVRKDDNERLNKRVSWTLSTKDTASKAGDANNDGVVNIQDTIIVINKVLAGDLFDQSADCNSDGQINIQDVICTINIVLNQ